MQSAVEADLSQLQLLFAIRKRFDPAIDTSEIASEIGARLREELDYFREAKHVALYRDMLKDEDPIRVPKVWPELSTGRLLTLDWLTGRKLLEHKNDTLADAQSPCHGDVHRLVVSVQPLRRHPRRPASRQLLCLRRAKGKPAGINLLDYGCIRIFPPSFVGGVVDLYRGLLRNDDDAGRACLRDLGLQAAQPRTDRCAQYLGTVHLRPAAGRSRAHHRRRGEAVRIRPQGGLPRASGAQGAEAR